VIKKLIDFEEDVWNMLVERVAKKYPKHFWDDEPLKGLSLEARILNLWPGILAFNYWYYLFHDLEGAEGWGSDAAPNWINIPEWGEIRYLFQKYDQKKKDYVWDWNPRWVWVQLTDETKGRRLLCRIRKHPEGEIYWNPGGDEPDPRCQTCGESIG
jgi:hypothetical protein